MQHAAAIGNVARTCRLFGISRKTFYKWRQRFVEHGDAGLCDRPTTPRRGAASHRGRGRQQDHVLAAALPLRRAADRGLPEAIPSRHHRPFNGAPHRDPAWLAALAGQSQAPRARQTLATRRKAATGHRLQVDVKFLERIPGTRGRFYQFTAIDDCTRMRVLKVFDACNQRTAIQFIDDVVRRLPFRVHVVQTDNGAEFNHSFTGIWSSTTFDTCTSGRGRRI
jgi:hypothetical protein